MGKRKDNPELVDELIVNRWNMSDQRFQEKFNSLSRDDQAKVTEVLEEMEDELSDKGASAVFVQYSGYKDWKDKH